MKIGASRHYVLSFDDRYFCIITIQKERRSLNSEEIISVFVNISGGYRKPRASCNNENLMCFILGQALRSACTIMMGQNARIQRCLLLVQILSL